MFFGDSVIKYPLSGSVSPAAVYVRKAEVATSASFYSWSHPGGTMSANSLLIPNNPNRKGWFIFVSSSLAGGLYLSGSVSEDFKLTPLFANNGIASGNNFTPCFTGDIYVLLVGAGTSGSDLIYVTELTN